MTRPLSLDDPARAELLERRIRGKRFLRRFYGEVYSRYAE
jgi:hypothetical protein